MIYTPGTGAAKERGRGHTHTHTPNYIMNIIIGVMKQASWKMKMRWSDSKMHQRLPNHTNMRRKTERQMRSSSSGWWAGADICEKPEEHWGTKKLLLSQWHYYYLNVIFQVLVSHTNHNSPPSICFSNQTKCYLFSNFFKSLLFF